MIFLKLQALTHKICCIHTRISPKYVILRSTKYVVYPRLTPQQTPKWSNGIVRTWCQIDACLPTIINQLRMFKIHSVICSHYHASTSHLSSSPFIHLILLLFYQFLHVLFSIFLVQNKLRNHGNIHKKRYCIPREQWNIKTDFWNCGKDSNRRSSEIHNDSDNGLSSCVLLVVVAINLWSSWKN